MCDWLHLPPLPSVVCVDACVWQTEGSLLAEHVLWAWMGARKSSIHVVSSERKETLYAKLLPTASVVQVKQSVRFARVCACLCVCVRTVTFELNCTFNLHIWHDGSTWLYLGQVRRSRSSVEVHDRRRKILVQWSARPWVKAFQFVIATHISAQYRIAFAVQRK